MQGLMKSRIEVTAMGEEKSIWQLIYDHLKAEGFEVYAPGQHVGECRSNYVVIKDAGANRLSSFSTDQALYDAMCYVPMTKFSALESYVGSVKSSLKKLFPMIKPTGYQTPSFLDDTNNSYMISVQYSNYRKIFYN